MRVLDETPAVLPSPTLVSRVRRLALRLLLCFVLLVASLFLLDFYNSRHPHLGRIYHTSAHDLNVARSNPLATFLSRTLPRAVVQSSLYPDRLKDQPKYLRIAAHQLEWSIGGPHTGWLYFWNVDEMPKRRYPWEFAETTETNFLSLRARTFPPLSKPLQPSTNTPSTNAIHVQAGAIIFARHTDEPKTTYILHLQKQQNDKLAVQYCVIGGRPSWQTTMAKGIGAGVLSGPLDVLKSFEFPNALRVSKNRLKPSSTQPHFRSSG